MTRPMQEVINEYQMAGQTLILENARLRTRIATLEAERDAWQAYAEHQERCAICGEAASICEMGAELKLDAARTVGNGDGKGEGE